MPLDDDARRLIHAIKRDYYDPRTSEKWLDYASDGAYSLFLDLLYQLCALLPGHQHPSRLTDADLFRLLDDPLVAGKAEETMARLRSDVMERLAVLHGDSARGRKAYEGLIADLLARADGRDRA